MATNNVEIPLGHGVDLLLTLRLGGGPLANNVQGEVRWDGRRMSPGPDRTAGSVTFQTTRESLRELADILKNEIL